MEINKSEIECTPNLFKTNDVEEITFDEKGACNYCNYYDKLYAEHVIKPKDRIQKYTELVSHIKKLSKGKKYDCVIGLSGGIDSTYVAYFVKKVLKLNPLAVHLDYG